MFWGSNMVSGENYRQSAFRFWRSMGNEMPTAFALFREDAKKSGREKARFERFEYERGWKKDGKMMKVECSMMNNRDRKKEEERFSGGRRACGAGNTKEWISGATQGRALQVRFKKCSVRPRLRKSGEKR
jgi:hypothetical protein